MRHKIHLRIFILFSLLICSAPAFAQVQTYDQLVSVIREVRRQTEARIEAAVEQEKVREAWETGKLIKEHILLNQERANYGEKVIKRLADDLGISARELQYMIEFARAYPIVRPAAQLSWSEYEALLSINDPHEREALAAQAEKENWGRARLREEVGKRNSSSLVTSHSSLPEVKPGKPGLYRISKNRAGDPYVDLGFSNYLKLEKRTKFKEGDIAELRKGKLETSQNSELSYTYSGQVLQILDGDTLRIEIDLGFGFTTVQKLRLKGIDAPELVSSEGKEAKAYLEKLLQPFSGRSSPLLIRTVKSDKYDRYLADLWAGKIYVNQKMLDEGFAVQMNE